MTTLQTQRGHSGATVQVLRPPSGRAAEQGDRQAIPGQSQEPENKEHERPRTGGVHKGLPCAQGGARHASDQLHRLPRTGCLSGPAAHVGQKPSLEPDGLLAWEGCFHREERQVLKNKKDGRLWWVRSSASKNLLQVDYRPNCET